LDDLSFGPRMLSNDSMLFSDLTRRFPPSRRIIKFPETLLPLPIYPELSIVTKSNPFSPRRRSLSTSNERSTLSEALEPWPSLTLPNRSRPDETLFNDSNKKPRELHF